MKTKHFFKGLSVMVFLMVTVLYSCQENNLKPEPLHDYEIWLNKDDLEFDALQSKDIEVIIKNEMIEVPYNISFDYDDMFINIERDGAKIKSEEAIKVIPKEGQNVYKFKINALDKIGNQKVNIRVWHNELEKFLELPIKVKKIDIFDNMNINISDAENLIYMKRNLIKLDYKDGAKPRYIKISIPKGSGKLFTSDMTEITGQYTPYVDKFYYMPTSFNGDLDGKVTHSLKIELKRRENDKPYADIVKDFKVRKEIIKFKVFMDKLERKYQTTETPRIHVQAYSGETTDKNVLRDNFEYLIDTKSSASYSLSSGGNQTAEMKAFEEAVVSSSNEVIKKSEPIDYSYIITANDGMAKFKDYYQGKTELKQGGSYKAPSNDFYIDVKLKGNDKQVFQKKHKEKIELTDYKNEGEELGAEYNIIAPNIDNIWVFTYTAKSGNAYLGIKRQMYVFAYRITGIHKKLKFQFLEDDNCNPIKIRLKTNDDFTKYKKLGEIIELDQSVFKKVTPELGKELGLDKHMMNGYVARFEYIADKEMILLHRTTNGGRVFSTNTKVVITNAYDKEFETSNTGGTDFEDTPVFTNLVDEENKNPIGINGGSFSPLLGITNLGYSLNPKVYKGIRYESTNSEPIYRIEVSCDDIASSEFYLLETSKKRGTSEIIKSQKIRAGGKAIFDSEDIAPADYTYKLYGKVLGGKKGDKYNLKVNTYGEENELLKSENFELLHKGNLELVRILNMPKEGKGYSVNPNVYLSDIKFKTVEDITAYDLSFLNLKRDLNSYNWSIALGAYNARLSDYTRYTQNYTGAINARIVPENFEEMKHGDTGKIRMFAELICNDKPTNIKQEFLLPFFFPKKIIQTKRIEYDYEIALKKYLCKVDLSRISESANEFQLVVKPVAPSKFFETPKKIILKKRGEVFNEQKVSFTFFKQEYLDKEYNNLETWKKYEKENIERIWDLQSILQDHLSQNCYYCQYILGGSKTPDDWYPESPGDSYDPQPCDYEDKVKSYKSNLDDKIEITRQLKIAREKIGDIIHFKCNICLEFIDPSTGKVTKTIKSKKL